MEVAGQDDGRRVRRDGRGWAGRRWFTEESIGRAVEGAGCRTPVPGYDGNASEHARRIIELALAGNPIERKTA